MKKKYLQIESAKRRILVVVKAEILDFEISVSDTPDADESTKISVSPSKELKSKDKVKAKENQYLHVSYKIRGVASGRPLVVHQSILQLTHINTKENFYFVVRPSNSRIYFATIDISGYKNYFANNSGKYNLTLLVGDSYIEKSISWRIGEIEITFNGKDERKILNPFEKKSIIEHKFRKPEVQADDITTDIFCFFIALPFVYLLIQALRFGNFSGIPGGMSSIYAFAFIISVAVLLSLNVIYWLQWKFFDAVYAGFIMSVPTAYFGSLTLSSISSNRKIKVE